MSGRHTHTQHSLFQQEQQNFAPTRLKVARTVRVMTKTILASKIGVDLSTLAKYEAGDRTPPTDTVEEIASRLNFPIDFFYGDDFDILDLDTPTFRSRRSMNAQLRDKVIGYGELALNCLSPELNRRYELPGIDILDLIGEDPENAAIAMRKHWRLGSYPISNMVRLLESKGVEIYWLNEDSPLVDAFSIQREYKPFILLNAHGRAGDRDRLNAAHELAHIILHRDKKRAEGRDIEAEAFRFATAFLLPAEEFIEDCPRFPVLSQFAPLKQKWGVSVGAMMRRAKDLGILSEWQYKQGYKEIAVRGWKKQEPASIAIPNEESLAHQKIFTNLAQKNISPKAFANEINIPLDDLVILMPAARAFTQSGRQFGHLRLV